MDNKKIESYTLKVRFTNRIEQEEKSSSFFREKKIFESSDKADLLRIVEMISVNNELSYNIEKTTKKWDDYLKCYEIQSIEVIEEGSNV